MWAPPWRSIQPSIKGRQNVAANAQTLNEMIALRLVPRTWDAKKSSAPCATSAIAIDVARRCTSTSRAGVGWLGCAPLTAGSLSASDASMGSADTLPSATSVPVS
eukprot:6213451-Pleurochrysis_carterae.AAC.2